MKSSTHDVLILGLGAMGSAATFHLARRGQKVLGLDRFRPPHQQGSSHGRSRAIRMAYFEDPAYVPLLHHAYRSWERLERDTGRTLLRRTGTLMLGPPESPVVSGSLRSSREHGLGHELLDSKELERRFPPLIPGPGTVGLLEQAGGVLSPEACIEAHLERSQALGADLRFDEPALSWRQLSGPGAVEVVTSRGRYRAQRLILAAGAWNPGLLGAGSETLGVSRQVLFWMKPAKEAARFSAPRLPVWVWAPAEGPVFYGFPLLEGGGPGLKVGIHTPGEGVNPESVDRTATPRDLEEIRACLRGRIRWLKEEPVRSCVCLYTNSPDGHFLLGEHPLFPSVILASGFSGHGFKFAALFGEILADLVIDGRTRHPIGIFDPRRPEIFLPEP